jgi:HK97 family phage prohead protease
METRTVTADVEFRDDAEPTIVGHAATFDQPYQVGFFTETIHRDAFKRTLASKPDVRLLINHEGEPLARTKSGTLELGTDATGLTVRAALDPSDPDVQRLIPKMRRGDMDQMSFAFRVPSGGDVWDHSGETPQRTIREASLSGGDVSIVTYPANENATAQMRSVEAREAAYTLATAYLNELREGREVDPTRLGEVLAALRSDGDPVTISWGVKDTTGTPAETPETHETTETHTGGLPLDLARRIADELRRKAA